MTQATQEDPQEFLIQSLAALLKVQPADIDTSVAFDRYGLDSAAAVELTGKISQWLGIEQEPTLLYDYPTIDTLSRYLFAKLEASAA